MTFPQYDQSLLQTAFTRMGMSFSRLGQLSGVNDKTARNVVKTGKAHPRNVYLVAKALGFKVKPNDLSAIMKTRKSA